MDFTFVILDISVVLFIGSYFFYCQIDTCIAQKCDAMMHNIDSLSYQWKILIEDRPIIESSFEKCRVEINKIKDEIDILKEQPKETPKPLRKLPLKSNEKASDEEKS